jgi:hypothetical protein
MIYYLYNPIEDAKIEFDTEQYPNAQELAQAKLLEIRQTYLVQEALRFHFAKVTQVENGEVWSNVDVNNDPEEGNYRVLNQYTGTYDSFPTLTASKADIAAKQQQFLTDCGLDRVLEIAQPVTTGTQTL